MKKNLRIASAAAAALLAVAPVAASTVSTVLADTPVTVDGAAQSNPATSAKLILNVTNVASLVDGDTPAKVAASISTPALPTGAVVAPGKASVYKVTGTTVADTATTDKLDAGATYVVKVDVNITGLTSIAASATKKININGVDKNVSAQGISDTVTLISDKFTIPDSKLIGTPYVKEKSVKVDNGSVNLDANGYNVTAVMDKIDASRGKGGKYTVATTGGENATAAKGSFQNLEQDVRDALKNAGITVKDNGSFDKPAAPFTVTTHLYATNGKTGTFSVRVNPDATNGDDTFPQVKYTVSGENGSADVTKTAVGTNAVIESIDSIKGVNFNYVPVNGNVDTEAIKKVFTVFVNAHDSSLLTPTVDASKVNTKVAGKYPVVVSATNADGKTTNVTFMLTVGVKGASYKTVQSDGDIPVYKIDGNNVTDSKTVVKNGDQIAIFGEPIKIGDKTYARINSADSDLYVESKYVDGTFKPADKVAKKVMHNAYIYDKDHKRVGTKTVAAYTNINVLGAVTKLADGTLAYQIDDNQYVLADNIDGTVRTLTHNAYVYKTSTKRADRRVLRKGAKVTTYGSPYTFKNGKAYYRIGGPAKQYVKVANF